MTSPELTTTETTETFRSRWEESRAKLDETCARLRETTEALVQSLAVLDAAMRDAGLVPAKPPTGSGKTDCPWSKAKLSRTLARHIVGANADHVRSSRTAANAGARHLAWCLQRAAGMTFAAIGQEWGRDHSTVVDGVQAGFFKLTAPGSSWSAPFLAAAREVGLDRHAELILQGMSPNDVVAALAGSD